MSSFHALKPLGISGEGCGKWRCGSRSSPSSMEESLSMIKSSLWQRGWRSMPPPGTPFCRQPWLKKGWRFANKPLWKVPDFLSHTRQACLSFQTVSLVFHSLREAGRDQVTCGEVLVQCKAGLKWMTATQRIDLSRVKESLDERERLLSLHDLHSPWTIWFDAWQEAWQQRAGLVTYCAWTARAMYGACTCNRGEEQFKCCTCMQQEPISRKWARLVLRCFTRDALQRFQSFKMPGLQGKLQPHAHGTWEEIMPGAQG